MGPKVTAACDFAQATAGRAGIVAPSRAVDIIQGRAATLVSAEFDRIEYWPTLLDQSE